MLHEVALQSTYNTNADGMSDTPRLQQNGAWEKKWVLCGDSLSWRARPRPGDCNGQCDNKFSGQVFEQDYVVSINSYQFLDQRRHSSRISSSTSNAIDILLVK